MANPKGGDKRNLKKFEPGQSGNPGGRPKSADVSSAMRKYLAMTEAELKAYKPKTVAEKIALGQVKDAVAGKRMAVDYVTNRVEGTPTATVRTIDETPGARMVIKLLQPAERQTGNTEIEINP